MATVLWYFFFFILSAYMFKYLYFLFQNFCIHWIWNTIQFFWIWCSVVRKVLSINKRWLVQIFATEIELDTAFHVYSAQFMKISCNNKDIFISLYRYMYDILTISKTYEAAVKNRPLWKAILFTAASWACIAASLWPVRAFQKYTCPWVSALRRRSPCIWKWKNAGA